MGFYEREFGVEIQQPLEYIDEVTMHALSTAAPNGRYAVLDVELDGGGKPTVLERSQPTPLTPDVLYREIRNRRPVQIIDEADPKPTSGWSGTYLKVARWFDEEVCLEYNNQVFQPIPKFADLRNANIGDYNIRFLVPRPVTTSERDEYHSEHHEHLTGFASYGIDLENDSTYRAVHYAVPDFRRLFASRGSELCQIVTDYCQDKWQFARDHGVDLYNPSDKDRILFYEIEKIMLISVIREESFAEATFAYLFEESLDCSREMTTGYYPNLAEDGNWKEACKLLGNFIERIATSQEQA